MSDERDEPREGSASKLAEGARVGPDSDTLPAIDAGFRAAFEDSAPDRSPASTLDPIVKQHMGRLFNEMLARSARTPDEISPGVRLGDYHVERRLGAGGMGEVFAARHVETGEPVALKTLTTTTATRLYRFKREFRALADVSHRNLIRLHELVVPETGSAYFTMELLDGQPFVAWVRGSTSIGELPDLDRLEEGLRQLVEGVHHLHSHDCIHRDLKPSNVLVTSEGRVVVLDFGLVSELSEPDRGITRDKQILGTPSYMAPEQALGKRVGPAADHYAIGVMLFECLTGRLPHEGSVFAQLLAKHDTTVDPGIDITAMPERLRTLCLRLLARDPAARPNGRELLERLRASMSTIEPAKVFVGRKQELATLHTALQEVGERHELVIVHLRGRSGDGKSALVRRFRSELRAEVVVLHGRCRERETVPYKGVDAVVDALSAHLRRLPQAERVALRPPDLDALVRLFPVLDEIWEPAEAQNLDLNEIRKLGGVTLRKLLKRMAEGRSLVVHIDDFQWADLDSVSLLQALARPPESPAMLLLLSYRPEAQGSEALRELLANAILTGPQARTVELGTLSPSDARELASSLLRAEGGADSGPQHARAEAIALRSRGSPFFIAQMALGGSEPDTADSDLDQIIVRRLSELDGHTRQLLELVAVFGGPLPMSLALELCAHSSDAAVGTLCGLGLLVRDEGRSSELDERIETAHDRVREVVLGELGAAEQARLHWRIGERLLELQDGTPKGDGVFIVVNHLDAGVGNIEALPGERRIELAKLNATAGASALESAAWVAAHRYLEYAHRLIEPWLTEAREGHGEYSLCVAIAFGRAQAAITLEDTNGDNVLDDLLSWSLSMADYGRIAQWRSWNLTVKGQWTECIEFGTRALARIGFRIPRHPSWPRALISYVWGWRSLRRTGIQQILSLPLVTDDHIRAGMEIVAAMIGSAATVDIKLQLALVGIHGRLIAKYGFHDGATVALSVFAVSAAVLGKTHEARALCEVVQNSMDHREISTSARYLSHMALMFVSPVLSPARAGAVSSEQIFQRACDVAPQHLVESIGMVCIGNGTLAGIPLSTQSSFLEALAARHGDSMQGWIQDGVVALRCMLRSYVEGQPVRSAIEIFDGLPNLNEVRRSIFGVGLIMAALFCGDEESAWELTGRIPRDYERKLGPTFNTPLYAMLSVVVMAERWPGSSNRERRRMRRMIRKRRATARRWAERCAENYQPMLDIIDGEIAALEERYEEAVTAFERAHAVASEGQITWLTGLASERLAKLARRRGHTILAEAAFDAAREAYEAWGATAVVRRLDLERTVVATR